MKKSVCLAMIVRDEAKVIRRCLASVRPFVTHYAIVDTGSTDGTQGVIVDAMQGLDGRVVDRKWQDFATNRNQALELAREVLEADGQDLSESYIFVIDADEELKTKPGLSWWPELEVDAYALRLHLVGTDNTWARRVLFRASQSWHYRGPIHEYLHCEEAEKEVCLFAGMQVESYGDGARNEVEGAKHKQDAKILRRLTKKHPEEPRWWFYLARAYAGQKQYSKAIEAYRRRTELGGHSEEVFWSLYQIGALRGLRGDDWRDCVHDFLLAHERRPWRAEPLWAAGSLYEANGMPAIGAVLARKACALPYPDDLLTVNASVYHWRSADLLAGCLSKLGKVFEARDILAKLRQLPQLPASEHERVDQNIELLSRHISRAA